MKRPVTLLLSVFFGLIALAFAQVLPKESVEVSQSESILACGGSMDPLYSLIVQSQSGDMQGVEGLAKSLYLDETPISYRECAHEQGNVLVVDNLTADEALRLRRAFVLNIHVDAWIHQRINMPVQSI